MSYDTSKDPCKKLACRIQSCLKENNYQEEKCLDALEQMRLCCIKWQKQSVCCSGININRSYLQNQTKDNNKTANAANIQ